PGAGIGVGDVKAQIVLTLNYGIAVREGHVRRTVVSRCRAADDGWLKGNPALDNRVRRTGQDRRNRVIHGDRLGAFAEVATGVSYAIDAGHRPGTPANQAAVAGL